MRELSFVMHVATAAVLVWLAVMDVRSRRLPNVWVLAVGLLFFANALVVRLPFADVAVHVGTAAFVLLVGAGLFALRMVGGGDAKLAAAISLWTGAATLPATLMLVSLVGLVVALLGLATRRLDPASCFGPMRALAMFSCQRGVPYGVALAAGGGAAILLPVLVPLLKH
ncbi:A24 family peptidase [Paraburkholderia caballeronis]|uniref:A24 family peptidase n=1 Tax=Paraburkholderia caballeronis TaxID=416943 RepID=UPI001064C745|nr:prepilin peptidase [Paraburkholderia caballeronis]TDV11675.1 prepilin peptidase CpaA [Paraburkholderia caballeronis]TDV14756.1 prepilin peptidase CpaA [Paraburkholderia caballeronis]TDV23876.1 prepilin peptidase CpaA [Paraburkholderia caballeronis]